MERTATMFPSSGIDLSSHLICGNDGCALLVTHDLHNFAMLRADIGSPQPIQSATFPTDILLALLNRLLL